MIRPTLSALCSLVLVCAASCTPADSRVADEDADAAPTAEPGAAGLDEAYRTVRELAPGIFSYELAPVGDPVTTVSLFVVTSEGVLVADGQGTRRGIWPCTSRRSGCSS